MNAYRVVKRQSIKGEVVYQIEASTIPSDDWYPFSPDYYDHEADAIGAATRLYNKQIKSTHVVFTIGAES